MFPCGTNCDQLHIQVVVFYPFRPHRHVPGYFLIRQFFFADSNISTFTRIRVQIEFAQFLCQFVS